MALPIYKSDDLTISQLQTNWAQLLNPVIDNPISAGLLLNRIQLVTGVNVINHKLGRKLQGWVVVRQRAAANLYDTQDSNIMPALTLQLTSSASVTIDLYVF